MQFSLLAFVSLLALTLAAPAPGGIQGTLPVPLVSLLQHGN